MLGYLTKEIHMNKFYTGVGSRTTPDALLEIMADIAAMLNERGFTLRSGAASGADCAFARGAIKKEEYIPWYGFRAKKHILVTDHEVIQKATRISESLHPKWVFLPDSVKKLMVRNVYTLLGPDLQTPSQFMVCWTPNGETVGGTGQAIRIARKYDIPVINLALPGAMENLYRLL